MIFTLLLIFYMIYPFILLSRVVGWIKYNWWIVLLPIWLPIVLFLASIVELAVVLALVEFA